MQTTVPEVTPLHLQHLAQLAEFDALTTSLRNAKTTSTPLSGLFLSPKPDSPLAQEHDIAQAHLKKLLDHPDYLALLRTKTGSTVTLPLTVTLKEGRGEYEATDTDGKMVPLPVTDRQSLRNHANSIQKSLLYIGGQLRSDRLLRLPQFLWYYGLLPEQPQNADTLDSLIQQLDELRANYMLGLETGMDIGDLIKETDHRPILDAVSLILDDDETSVIESLGKEVLVNVAADKLRATPVIFLNRLLSSNKAQWLAEKLLEQLKWYGAQPDEEPDSAIKKRLVAEAIRRWYSLTNDEPDDTIKRFRLEQSSNWGKSYRTLRSEFEAYLIDSGHVSTTNEAILLARLLQPQLPAEFQVRDIPEDLPYRSSVVWVNFVHGVNLVKAIDRSLIPRMTFQQFVDFPIKKSEGAPPELLDLIALTRITPTLDWALTNGFLDQQLDHYHSEETILLATDELKNQTDRINEAITCLAAPTPNRLTIAKNKLVKIFGSGTFNADHTKLVEEANEYTVNPIRFGGPVGRKQVNAYTFVDVYASGNIYNGKKWFFTDGVIVSDKWIKLDTDKTVESNAFMATSQNKIVKLPDVELLFKASFNIHLYLQRSAYQKLIMSQLATLPLADRLALEYGEVEILTLRINSSKTAERETPAVTLPLRARKGFVLAVNHENQQSYFELLPSIGIIRRLPDFKSELIGGKPVQAHWGNVPVTYFTYKTLPFDWDAHASGTQPKNNPSCKAIIDRIGEKFTAPKINENHTAFPCTLKSQRLKDITYFIAHDFFHVDEDLFRTSAYGETKFDKEQKVRDKVLTITKIIIPFWSSIEDLASGDINKIKGGFIGIFVDVATFLLPIGKFASGSLRLATTSGKLSIRATLPSFLKLTKKLFTSTLNNLNPIDGIPSLLGALGAGVFRLGKLGLFKLKGLAGRPGQYDFVQGLPQTIDPGRWKPLAAGDQLGSVSGIDDVVLRRANAGNIPSYHLIDPLSAKPYGPALKVSENELSIGPSLYPTAGKNSDDLLFKVPENVRIREVLEVDGRSTFFLDDVPYRLDDDSLRRVSSLDASEKLKQLPCRIPRAPGGACKTRYVLTDTPATRPQEGTFTEEKSWAPWFGDNTYYPSTPASADDASLLAYEGKIYQLKDGKLNTYKGKPKWIGLEQRIPTPKEVVLARLESQTGIYGSLNVTGTAEKIDDIHIVGAIIVPSRDEKIKHVFTKLNTDDYYLASRSTSDAIDTPLTMKRLRPDELLEDTLGGELQRVYVGSLNSNNTARIYGIDRVKIALDRMDKIAISIGAPIHPPFNMKFVKVDTSSAEALMFDHRTRMIVAELPDGAALWTSNTLAPDKIQKSTADIFNALFTKAGSSTQLARPVAIDQAMIELQKLFPTQYHSGNLKNIAIAKVNTVAGQTEVYVSVSGIGNGTQYLPLFKSIPGVTEVKIGNSTYFNIDGIRSPIDPTSLHLSSDGKLLAIPHPMNDANSTDALNRVTSADSESKLISYISEKYPNAEDIKSMTVVTTLPPCDSCSIVMKEFGHERGASALNVIWGRRPNVRKRPANDSSSSSGSATDSH
jgi:hypothetical protein